MPWFDLETLKSEFPYQKVQNAHRTFVEQTLIPNACRFVHRAINAGYVDPPSYVINDLDFTSDLLAIAKNITVNMILADDESVRIAQARGQTSINVAGDTITLDLTSGRNPYLSPLDEATLTSIRDQSTVDIHTDKMLTQASMGAYRRAPGGSKDAGSTDYTTSDLPGWRRPWGSTGSGT